MGKILNYSLLLILGLITSQIYDMGKLQPYLHILTMISLSYIMIEVGLEFIIDKNNLSSYAFDFFVAMTAAVFPWLLCSLYLYDFVADNWMESLLIGRFAAPTSAGILLAMLAAAGLGATWLFRKAEILAIYDDLGTILLMIPLQIMIIGYRNEMFFLLGVIFLLLFVAYRYLHQLKAPTNSYWLLFLWLPNNACRPWLSKEIRPNH